jgi:hypothetical protein
MEEEIWLEPPFNMLICGITNCGKTHYILDLLETQYRNKFDYILIFCPTFLENKTYEREFIYKDNDVIIVPVGENLDAWLKLAIEVYKNSNTLFIIDDCANLDDTKKKTSKLTELGFSGRHSGISTWVIVQKYNAVVKDFRDNIRMLILYFNKDKDAMKAALNENHIITMEQENQILEHLRTNKKSKVVLNLEDKLYIALK